MIVCLLATGVTVGTSALHTFRGFLRAEAEARLDRTTSAVSADLAREADTTLFEVERLASSDPVRAAIAGDLRNPRGLESALDAHPRFAALLVERRDGEIAAWVGERRTIPEGLRRTPTDQAERSARTPDGLELVSAPVRRPDGALQGWLHAVLSDAALASLLVRHAHASGSVLSLTDADGLLAASRPDRLPPALAPEAGHITLLTDASGAEWLAVATALRSGGPVLTVGEPIEQVYAPVAPAVKTVLLGWMILAVGSCLAAFGLVHSISRPVVALSDAARRIAAGERDIDLPARRTGDEIGVLTSVFNDMTHELARNAREIEASHLEIERTNQQLRDQNDALQRANEVLEQLSITDGLTRLHNHRFFQEYLDKEIKRAARSGRPLCLILIDVDHFKRWNDSLGHAEGDEILRTAADVMNGLIRESDLLARYGGDEFALLAPGTELAGALRLAEKIRQAISQTVFFPSEPGAGTPVTTSIGVAAYRGDRRAFFNEADQALYAAKAGGRDCVMAAPES